MRIMIDRNQLRAALLTAATNDVRDYLKGVYVEATPTETRLTATNGHMASIQRHKAENDCTASLIIPYDVVKAVKPHKTVNTIAVESEGDMWKLFDVGTMTTFKAVDGRFPDYRSMIPTSVSKEPGQFNYEYMIAFSKASKILGRKSSSLIVDHNGNGTATVCIGEPDSYIGVIMPLNVNDTTFPSILNITDHWSKT